MTYPMHFTDNANSWRRILMLARLYWPGLRPGFIFYACVPALLIFLAAGFYRLTGIMPSIPVCFVLSLMIYLSPVLLAHRDYRFVSAQLPTTATEKLSFLLLTFVITAPLVMAASIGIGELASLAVFDTNTIGIIEEFVHQKLVEIQIDWLPNSLIVILDLVCWTSVIIVVLYYVCTTQSNRVLVGIASYIILSFATGMVSAIIVILLLIPKFVDIAQITPDEPVLIQTITESMISSLWIVTALSIAIGLFYTCKLYKHLRNSGF